MNETVKRKRIRLIIEVLLTAAAVLIVGLVLARHAPNLMKLLRSGSAADMEAYIKEHGREGGALLILLQIIETIAIVLPAMPVYICAGAIYGKIKGVLMCYLTNLVMNLLIFLVARRLKTRLAEFASIEKNPKLEQWIKAARRPERIVFLMCLLPIIPNGMIPYISAQTEVTVSGFMKALALGCLPGIVVFVCFGDILSGVHIKITLPILVAAVLLVGLFMLMKKRIAEWLEPMIQKFLG